MNAIFYVSDIDHKRKKRYHLKGEIIIKATTITL